MLAAVTLLNSPNEKKKKKPVDWDKYVVSGSERGQHVDEYMKEMREDDRSMIVEEVI